MSELGRKQRLLARLLARLLDKAYELGYEVSLGDAYRDPRVHGQVGEKKSYSSANSNHKRRLAIDLNLFKDGKYLTGSEQHRELGTYWESLDVDCVWGGHFNDGNHYAIKYGGFS